MTRTDDQTPGAGPAPPGATETSLGGQLVVVATPIGNLGDITARALDTLRTAALIACEDTRTTGKLLHRFGIDTKMAPYHEHNAEWARPKILETLRAGRTVALVSDAGTPLVSDPGYRLVQACLEEGVRVTVAPGPSAPVAALVLSGLPSASFYFGGFLPNKSAARRKALEAVRAVPSTLIFFESPNRLAASLADAAEVLGERDVAVAREITKLHEEVRRGPLGEIASHYAAAGAPKGEIVLVIAPPAPERKTWTEDDLDARLRDLLGEMSTRDAARQLAEEAGMPRRAVYDRALRLLKGPDGSEDTGR